MKTEEEVRCTGEYCPSKGTCRYYHQNLVVEQRKSNKKRSWVDKLLDDNIPCITPNQHTVCTSYKFEDGCKHCEHRSNTFCLMDAHCPKIYSPFF